MAEAQDGDLVGRDVASQAVGELAQELLLFSDLLAGGGWRGVVGGVVGGEGSESWVGWSGRGGGGGFLVAGAVYLRSYM